MQEFKPLPTARLLALIELPAPAIRETLEVSFPAADAAALTARAITERGAFERELAAALSADANELAAIRTA